MNQRLVLVPGFMSPAWMLWPLSRFLRRDFDHVLRWDYPRVFSSLDSTTKQLARLIDSLDSDLVHIVAHSFGDWLVRAALHHVTGHRTVHLVSVCPVTTAVPLVERLRGTLGRMTPELSTMSSVATASVALPTHLRVSRYVVHAALDMIVRREVHPNQRIVKATHNSILFQPNGWSAIAEAFRALDANAKLC